MQFKFVQNWRKTPSPFPAECAQKLEFSLRGVRHFCRQKAFQIYYHTKLLSLGPPLTPLFECIHSREEQTKGFRKNSIAVWLRFDLGLIHGFKRRWTRTELHATLHGYHWCASSHSNGMDLQATVHYTRARSRRWRVDWIIKYVLKRYKEKQARISAHTMHHRGYNQHVWVDQASFISINSFSRSWAKQEWVVFIMPRKWFDWFSCISTSKTSDRMPASQAANRIRRGSGLFILVPSTADLS